MRRGLPAIIYSSQPSDWESCRTITHNIVAAYRITFGVGGFRSYFYTNEDCLNAYGCNGGAVVELAEQIFAARPERIILADHSPHPYPLFVALAQAYGGTPLPPVYIHVYGDFSLKAEWWLRSEKILRKTRVTFLCASVSHAKLISGFVKNPLTKVRVVPFSVNTTLYAYKKSLREQWRAQLGLEKNEMLFVYSGRLSLQKNVERMIREVAALMNRSGRKTRFVMAGRYDDLGAPFFGVNPQMGASFHRMRDLMNSLGKNKASIQLVGHLSATELAGLYNAADRFISLSVHHDEDFGMAPAEALCCGLPALLTRWGGYANFASTTQGDCEFVDVSIARKGGLELDTETLAKLLDETVSHQHSDRQRTSRSDRYAKGFSVAAIAARLKKIHDQPASRFQGFEKPFLEWSLRLENWPSLFPRGPTQRGLYSKIYRSYM